jgi:hypothetical protein
MFNDTCRSDIFHTALISCERCREW